MYLSDLNQEK